MSPPRGLGACAWSLSGIRVLFLLFPNRPHRGLELELSKTQSLVVYPVKRTRSRIVAELLHDDRPLPALPGAAVLPMDLGQ